MGIEEKRMGIEVGEVGEEACVFGGWIQKPHG
jgi:hypothetical protein